MISLVFVAKILSQRRVATYHVTVSGKHTRSEFIHIHTVNILYCRATLAFSLELAGIRIHCTPFESAVEAESKIDYRIAGKFREV